MQIKLQQRRKAAAKEKLARNRLLILPGANIVLHLCHTISNTQMCPIHKRRQQQVYPLLKQASKSLRKRSNNMGSKFIGRHIITDPRICHGQPTFRGTRVLVFDVLDQVADGLAWETIIEDWNGSISREAIAEAVSIATQALHKHTAEFILEPSSV
jgi:uncharacterized protein (DUF433 family)